MTKYFAPWWLVALLVLVVGGCVEVTAPTPSTSPQVTLAPAAITQAPPATLVPTFTPLPQASPPPTAATVNEPTTAEAAEETAVAQDFNEIIVDLRYAVGATGLARRLQGNRASRITFVDETSGQATAFSNQGGVLLELRQALSGLQLEPVPADCDLCVIVQYELSIEAQRGEGWLQDPVLLASIENFMSIALGPHFPAETVVGLRRSASPYAPAHTLALTGDGELWTWLATDGQIAPPTTAISDTQPLQASLAALTISAVNPEYVVRCEGAPVETMYLNPSGEDLSVSIVCPAYALPSILLPLYLQLERGLRPVLTDVALEQPPAAFPLEALVDYRRADGTRLTLFQDGQLVMLNASSEHYTSTLSATQVVTLTQALWTSGVLEPGLSTFGVGATATITPGMATAIPQATSVLVLRGPDGLYDGEWSTPPDVPALAELDALLDENLGLAPAELPTGAATADATETATGEATMTPTASVTPEPQATATP